MSLRGFCCRMKMYSPLSSQNKSLKLLDGSSCCIFRAYSGAMSSTSSTINPSVFAKTGIASQCQHATIIVQFILRKLSQPRRSNMHFSEQQQQSTLFQQQSLILPVLSGCGSIELTIASNETAKSAFPHPKSRAFEMTFLTPNH